MVGQVGIEPTSPVLQTGAKTTSATTPWCRLGWLMTPPACKSDRHNKIFGCGGGIRTHDFLVMSQTR